MTFVNETKLVRFIFSRLDVLFVGVTKWIKFIRSGLLVIANGLFDERQSISTQILCSHLTLSFNNQILH